MAAPLLQCLQAIEDHSKRGNEHAKDRESGYYGARSVHSVGKQEAASKQKWDSRKNRLGHQLTEAVIVHIEQDCRKAADKKHIDESADKENHSEHQYSQGLSGRSC